jgi:glutamate-1-semialdehyde aminotransferase
MGRIIENKLKTLQQSINDFNLLVSEYFEQTEQSSKLVSQRFMTYKKKMKPNTSVDMVALKKAVYREDEELQLNEYKNTIKMKFSSCYALTVLVLSKHLEDTFSITTDDSQELFQQCIEKGVITHDEAQSLIALSHAQESEETINIIECGITIHRILKRLN